MADTKKTEKVEEKTTARVESKTITGKVVEVPKVAPKVAPKPKITNVYNADFSVIDDTIEVTMAIPAEGPSFGVAPSGTCI